MRRGASPVLSPRAFAQASVRTPANDRRRRGRLVLGGFVAPWIRTRVRFGQIMIGSVIVWAGAVLLLALAPSALLLIVGIGVTGLLWPIYGVTLVTYRLSITPEHLQGRVNSAFRFLSYGSEPLGAASRPVAGGDGQAAGGRS